MAALLLLLSVPAYLYLLPNELTAYGGSVLAATFSVSNFYFLLHTGYFAAPAYYLPLLHTWSLAIEEQFYIFLPLFILLLHRLAPRLLPLLLLAAAVLSFLLCLHETAADQAAAFYLPWTRGWELLLGTLIALGLFAQPRTAALAQYRSARRAGADSRARRDLQCGDGLSRRQRARTLPGRGADHRRRPRRQFLGRAAAVMATPWSSSAGSLIRSISGTGRSSSS